MLSLVFVSICVPQIIGTLTRYTLTCNIYVWSESIRIYGPACLHREFLRHNRGRSVADAHPLPPHFRSLIALDDDTKPKIPFKLVATTQRIYEKDRKKSVLTI